MAHSTGPFEAVPASSRSTAVTGNFYAVLSILIWAAGFPAADSLLEVMNPLALITFRFLMASAFLLPLWWVVDGRSVLLAPWRWGLTFGGISFGFGAFLLLVAQDLTDAVTVAIISAAAPLFASVLELVTGSRRMRPSLLVGLAAAIIGGIVAIGGQFNLEIGLGALAGGASCILFVIGSHLSVQAMPQTSAIGRATLPLVGGTVVMTLLLGVSELAGWSVLPERMLTTSELNMLAIYAVGAMAISQIFFIASVGKIGVALTSFHINTAPFYVMLIAAALGSGWSWPQAIGGAIVVSGALLIQMRP